MQNAVFSSPDPSAYLQRCDVIDWDDPDVRRLADELAGQGDRTDVTENCFNWVRDEIKHSGDHRLNPVTCSASEVLRYGTGYCYAKSHLLCALLRANRIPAGLCYQRLLIEPGGTEFCLHGLCAVHVQSHGWYRIDPRGNRTDVDAQFKPPWEQLAFLPGAPGEADLPTIYASPLPIVVNALRRHEDWDALLADLPDVSSIED